jgi:hypothetical protein
MTDPLRCGNCRSFGEEFADGYGDCHHDEGHAAYVRAQTPACEHFAPASDTTGKTP